MISTERRRDALAYLKCCLADDTEGMQVILRHAHLDHLLADISAIAVTALGFVAENPAHHLDLMFHAVATEGT